jgi:hypothetical protein
MQRTSAHLYFECFCVVFCFLALRLILLILFCIILMLSTHPPACSGGDTPLKLAIDENKPDVEALLRSVLANAAAAAAAAFDGDCQKH